jgi:formylglycine-generating enzyme
VGAYTGTTSPYGTFDMGGNVFQWNEALRIGGMFRGLRGGYFEDPSGNTLSSGRSASLPDSEGSAYGFRVASIVPEPSAGVLAVIACGMMWWWRKRFK